MSNHPIGEMVGHELGRLIGKGLVILAILLVVVFMLGIWIGRAA